MEENIRNIDIKERVERSKSRIQQSLDLLVLYKNLKTKNISEKNRDARGDSGQER